MKKYINKKDIVFLSILWLIVLSFVGSVVGFSIGKIFHGFVGLFSMAMWSITLDLFLKSC